MLRRVHRSGGDGPFSRETLAELLGYKPLTGTANRAVGALTHFGLLDRSKSTYSISQTGQNIIMPPDDGARAAALVAAAKSPALYADLISEFKDKGVPLLLGNILAQRHGVLPKNREQVAQRFKETMEFVGLLRSGVLHEQIAYENGAAASSRSPVDTCLPVSEVTVEQSSSPGPQSGTRDSAASSLSTQVSPRAPQQQQEYTIALGLDGRVARILLPTPVSEGDLRRVEDWASYMRRIATETPDASGD